MDSGETYEREAHEHTPDSWKGMASPPSEITKSSELQIPPFYNNTLTTQSLSTSQTPYPQDQRTAVNTVQGNQTTGPQYHDPYRYHQPTAVSSGTNTMMQRPGGHPSSGVWQGNNPPAQQNYASPDRNRYAARAPYPGTYPDSSKHYNAMAPQQGSVPQQGSWPRAPYPSSHSGYNEPPRATRYVQSDIAGPVVPAGLQALQANNNNATLMQHQHTPMLVPNPHYNQNRAQQVMMASQTSESGSLPESQKSDLLTPQRPGITNVPQENIYSPLPPNNHPMGYYPTHSPHAQQHRTMGPMHNQMGLNSQSVSPYPSNPSTPGPVKGKTRGNKTYQCPKCVKVFRRGDHLKRHLLSVHDHEHPYQCGECGKGFASVATLSKHTKSLHIGILTKGLMCLRCQLTFPTIQEMEIHSNSLHVQEDEQYMQNINTSSKQHHCNCCTKSFSSAINLKRHMQLLHRNKDETKVFCRDCGKGFKQHEALRKHVDKIHNGNLNALPPLDDAEDPETSSQAHSSESESRGPSADTDESSMSSTPSNMHWGSYPTPPSSQDLQKSVISQPGNLQPPGPNIPSYQLQSNQGPSSTADQITSPPFTQTNSEQVRINKQQQIPISQSTKPPAIDCQQILPDPVPVNQQVTTLKNDLGPVQVQHHVIQPRSVSEALSMAMKALSEFDYETGFDMYGFQHDQSQSISRVSQPTVTNSGLIQTSTTIPPRNGVSGILSSPRTTESSNNNNMYDFPQHGNHFLMTTPPLSGTMTMSCPLPIQPPMAGSQKALPLSLLLQEGGGGVKSPIVMNDHNNYNVTNENVDSIVSEDKKSKRRKRKRIEFNDNDSVGSFAEEYERNPQNEVTQDEKVDLSCNLCKIEYESIDSLMVHIEGVHLKNNPHECTICQKHFAQAGNVKRHIRFVHLKERPFRCNSCSSTFDRLCYLQRHMRTHLQPSDENQEFDPLKPCNCPECGKRCMTAHHLRGHMQRKHFAKNKQNYSQFLMKYGHLEAIGSGPGAKTSAKKKSQARKRKAEEDTDHNPVTVSAFGESHNIQASSQSSSILLPHSSSYSQSSMPTIQHQYVGVSQSTNSTFQSYLQPSATSTTLPLQQNFNYYNQQQAFVYQNNQSNTVLNNNLIMNDSGIKVGISHEMVNYMYGSVQQQPSSGTNFSNMSTTSPISKLIENVHFNNVKSEKPSDKVTKRDKARKRMKKSLPFRCQHCVLKSFASLAMLRSHMSLVHNATLKRQVCLTCGLSFHRQAHLKSHIIQAHPSNTVEPKKQSQNTLSELSKVSNAIAMEQFADSPLCKTQQNYQDQNMASYFPAAQQLYFGYDPMSPAMVPSPNMQSVYSAPSHQMNTHMPLVQS